MGLTRTFRKKRSMSKRMKKRTLKKGKRVVRKMKTRRGRTRNVRRSIRRRSSSRRRMKGGKLNPLIPMPLREIGGAIQNQFDKSIDIINGTNYTIDPDPTEGQLVHNSI